MSKLYCTYCQGRLLKSPFNTPEYICPACNLYFQLDKSGIIKHVKKITSKDFEKAAKEVDKAEKVD